MNEEVIRTYSVLPAIEQTKLLIIDKLKLLFDSINILYQNKLMNKKDDEIIAIVKSTTISLYIMLKPKMLEYISQHKRLGSSFAKALENAIPDMDALLSNPSNMGIENALWMASIINAFCHEYGITKITYFSGTAIPKDKDIYKI